MAKTNSFLWVWTYHPWLNRDFGPRKLTFSNTPSVWLTFQKALFAFMCGGGKLEFLLDQGSGPDTVARRCWRSRSAGLMGWFSLHDMQRTCCTCVIESNGFVHEKENSSEWFLATQMMMIVIRISPEVVLGILTNVFLKAKNISAPAGEAYNAQRFYANVGLDVIFFLMVEGKTQFASGLLYVVPVIDWWPVHGVPRPCPMSTWIGCSPLSLWRI